MNHLLCTAMTAVTVTLATTAATVADPPSYTIVDLGEIDPGDFGLQGQGVSPGGVGVGRALGVSNQGFRWTADGGLMPLPNLSGRPFGSALGANDAGACVGIGATTLFGAGALPLIWEEGTVAQLPLPAGESVGRAYDINDAGLAVGSVDGGSAEQAAMYTQGGASAITTTAADGSSMTVAFGVNNAGLVIGPGTDPNNAARNVGLVYDSVNDVMVEVGAVSGANGAIAFAVSDGGHVVGSSMMNQGSGMPFIWTEANGIAMIPLPTGTSQGSARGVNASGWVVGIASNAFAIPFVSDGTETWALCDLLPDGTDWDLCMNTSSGALGIADDGTIIGTGVLNGDVRAFAMIPDAPCSGDLDGSGAVDVDDLLSMLGAWGECPGCDQDLNDDDVVDVNDLLDLLANWGSCG